MIYFSENAAKNQRHVARTHSCSLVRMDAITLFSYRTVLLYFFRLVTERFVDEDGILGRMRESSVRD